jgi:hypothetical protein
MSFEVLLTEDANRDLEDIYTYVAEHDAPGKAEDLLDRIEEVIESLATSLVVVPFPFAELSSQKQRPATEKDVSHHGQQMLIPVAN